MTQDLGPDKQAIGSEPDKRIKSGFVWMGAASIASQVLMALAMVVAMVFLSQEEIGISTIVIAVAACLEAFAGLGMGQAILQDNDLTQDEVHSAFWFAFFFGIAVFVVGVPLVWPVAAFYGYPALVPLLMVGLAKFTLSSWAALPISLVNRRLEYEKLGAVTVLSTLWCTILKIVLAFCGCGAWALVIGDAAGSLGMLVGGLICSKYRPAFHFKWSECRRFIGYGTKTCIWSLIDQLNKNLHFLLLGKFLPASLFGGYKVAYELAMTPALSVFNVVTKSSFPVFARFQDSRPDLTKLFFWNQKNISIFVAVASVFIWISGGDMFDLVVSGDNDWEGAVKAIPFILVVAFTKSLLQAYPDLYRACGKPEYGIYSSLVEAGLIFVCCGLSLMVLPESYMLYGMLTVWEIVLLLVFAMHCVLVRRFIDSNLKMVWQHIKDSVFFAAFSGLLAFALVWGMSFLPLHGVIRIILEFACVAVCLKLFAKFRLKMPVSELWSNSKSKPKDVG